MTPKRVQIDPKQYRVVQVAAGSSFSLFLTSNGQVLSCGRDDSRQRSRLVPTVITSLTGVVNKVTKIAAGRSHWLALADVSIVLSCGSGEHGKLGHGNAEDVHIPARIMKLAGAGIVQIAAGQHHSLFLNSQGVVYSCGGNAMGQLGHGMAQDMVVPREIEQFKENVVMVTAGALHSAFLCADGQVWCCGDGRHGVLGNGENGKRGLRQLKPAAMVVDPELHAESAGADSFFFPASKHAVD